MTDPCQCEVCGKYLNKKNLIQLMVRVVSFSGYEDIPYLYICTDCEWDEKKRRSKRSRNDGST